MSIIEVFRTNVETANDATNIVKMLLGHFPGSRINFDLQDCDKILRVEGKDFSSDKVIALLKENGFHCSILE
jgi:tRNA G26 N,N-dimethylase Trm1